MEQTQRGQFTFYSSFFQGGQLMEDKLERCDFYDALIRFALNGEEPDGLTGKAAVAFALARPNLEASRRKAEAGAQGGSLYTKWKQEQEQDKEQDKDRVIEKGQGQRPVRRGQKTDLARLPTQNTERLRRNIEALRRSAAAAGEGPGR